MFRRGLIVPFVLAAVPVAAAAWVLSPALIDTGPSPDVSGQKSARENAGLLPPGLDALMPRGASPGAAGFDVARIDRDGWSVFAGTAPPSSTVTVTADGLPIGSAKADERGEWTLLSDHKFAETDPVLGLSTSFDQPPRKPVAERLDSQTKSAAAAVDPARRMMRALEDLVAAAREPEQPAEAPSTLRAPLPIPIQFVFRQAAFTGEGRQAAGLLLEYLKLKKPDSIVLTGHADERGSDAFNVELSRQRLETVAGYLRENGFEGKLVLIPKGSSEPYQDVDRASLDRQMLFQLDRRVELDLGTGAERARSAHNGRAISPR
ncbi:MAG: OmpA family protein [Hyphomicrobiaceae bacterium]|nr:OmpA family protein [Hyphomicrobiaceae bacterium]